MFGELADEKTIVAIKESSDNVRRVTDIINRVGDRYAIFCGVDDLAMEAMLMGAVGWVAGLVDAFPRKRWRSIGCSRKAAPKKRGHLSLVRADAASRRVAQARAEHQAVEAIVGVGTETKAAADAARGRGARGDRRSG